jgi:hypothetical protein
MGDIYSMNVKTGERVICDNDRKNRKNNRSQKLVNITKGNVYIVLDTKKTSFPKSNNKPSFHVKCIKILGDQNKECWVTSNRFIANEEKVMNQIRWKNLNKILNDEIEEL